MIEIWIAIGLAICASALTAVVSMAIAKRAIARTVDRTAYRWIAAIYFAGPGATPEQVIELERGLQEDQ